MSSVLPGYLQGDDKIKNRVNIFERFYSYQQDISILFTLKQSSLISVLSCSLTRSFTQEDKKAYENANCQ